MIPGALAEVCDYSDLHAALRARAEALNVSRETIDHVAGLQDGYASKILAPRPIKGIGKLTLGPILRTLGIKLVMIEDVEALAKMRGRLVPRSSHNARSAPIDDDEARFRRTMALAGRRGGAARKAAMTEQQRRDGARRAANARWRGRKRRARAGAGEP